MLNLNRLFRNKFGLSILFSVITSVLLIAVSAINIQPITRANEITKKKNKLLPCKKIDPKYMKASPSAPPPPVMVKMTGLGSQEGGAPFLVCRIQPAHLTGAVYRALLWIQLVFAR
ncbi:MAG TPA: hypothetical protein VJ810_19195 [Blastocatellia bacterium]|nr:hypothetical protein [Blastocatellia bacterium]